jgi:hypothetical protein
MMIGWPFVWWCGQYHQHKPDAQTGLVQNGKAEAFLAEGGFPAILGTASAQKIPK